jgi:D-alanine-D-alanine ligase
MRNGSPRADNPIVRITVLTWLESERAREHDVVVDQVAGALTTGGHRVSIVGVHGDVQRLVDGVKRTRPELVFNLMEMFDDNLLGDVAVAGLLELCGVPYTGCGPGELYLRQDKALAKQLLHYEGIAYPRFAVFAAGAGGRARTGGDLRMPLFVKPLRGDASIGVDAASLVRDRKSLLRRVRAIHDVVHDAALAEEFIEGRELYVGILGNEKAEALPVIEMDFSGLPAGVPRVVGQRAKFDESSAEFKGTRAVVARLPAELRARVHAIALAAYRALRVRDYGRVDLRLDERGQPYVIEVNASCYLEEKCEFAMAARAAGIDYVTLVNRIVELALERFRRRTRPVAAAPLGDEARTFSS